MQLRLEGREALAAGFNRQLMRHHALAAGLALGVALWAAISEKPAAHPRITTSVTWTRDISRILERRCLVCHRDGGAAPMSLASYDEARPWARAIREEALERRMPPSGLRSGATLYENARTLSYAELELLVSWVDGGAPRGDEPADSAPAPPPAQDWSATFDGELGQGKAEGQLRFRVPARWIGAWALDASGWPLRSAVLRTTAGEVVGRWTAGDPPVRYPPGAGIRPSGDDGLVAEFVTPETVVRDTLGSLPPPKLQVAWTSEAKSHVVHRTVTSSWTPARPGTTVLALRLELQDPASTAGVTVARADGRREFLMTMAPPGVPDPISYRLREPMVMKPGDRIEVDATSTYVLDIEELGSMSRTRRSR
jgi:hypothetical protein